MPPPRMRKDKKEEEKSPGESAANTTGAQLKQGDNAVEMAA